MKNSEPVQLSEAGQQRRDAMLNELQQTMATHTRHQRNKRRVLLGSCMVIIACLSWSLFTSDSIDQQIAVPSPASEENKSDSPNTDEPSSKSPPNTLVNVEPANEENSFITFELISDEELIALFKEMGTNVMIATINDKKVVISKDGELLSSL